MLLHIFMRSVYFPKFLKAFGLSYMPVYCSKRRTLYLVSEPVWSSIQPLFTYNRPAVIYRNKRFKRINFVHEFHLAKFHPITPARWDFLKHFNLIIRNPSDNPSLNTATTICIDSCWLFNRYQPLYKRKYGSYYGGFSFYKTLLKVFSNRRRKPRRTVKIKSGYLHEPYTTGLFSPLFNL